MSLVNQTTLNRFREMRNRAHDSDSYNLGYRLAMEALNGAIAQLEQLDMITHGYTVKMEKV